MKDDLNKRNWKTAGLGDFCSERLGHVHLGHSNSGQFSSEVYKPGYAHREKLSRRLRDCVRRFASVLLRELDPAGGKRVSIQSLEERAEFAFSGGEQIDDKFILRFGCFGGRWSVAVGERTIRELFCGGANIEPLDVEKSLLFGIQRALNIGKLVSHCVVLESIFLLSSAPGAIDNLLKTEAQFRVSVGDTKLNNYFDVFVDRVGFARLSRYACLGLTAKEVELLSAIRLRFDVTLPSNFEPSTVSQINLGKQFPLAEICKSASLNLRPMASETETFILEKASMTGATSNDWRVASAA